MKRQFRETQLRSCSQRYKVPIGHRISELFATLAKRNIQPDVCYFCHRFPITSRKNIWEIRGKTKKQRRKSSNIDVIALHFIL